MRVDKSVIVLFRQMNLFLNRELLDEKLTSSDVLYLARAVWRRLRASSLTSAPN